VDKSQRKVNFEEGDEVWLNIKKIWLPEGLSHKFLGPYASPFKVLEKKFPAATLALGSQPRQRFARAGAKKSVKECENEDSHSLVNSHFGSWNPGGLPNLQRTIEKVKTPCIEKLFISSKNY